MRMEGYLVLEDFDLRVEYVGRIRWDGKQKTRDHI